MPQLDTVTFFSQYVWLCFFFCGFYLCIVKYYLPRMGRILKIRQKKMTLSEAPTVSTEAENLRSLADNLVFQATKQARGRLAESSQKTWEWSSAVVSSTNSGSGHFAAPNRSYESSLATASLQQSRIVHNMTVCVGGVVPGTEVCEASQKMYAANLFAVCK